MNSANPLRISAKRFLRRCGGLESRLAKANEPCVMGRWEHSQEAFHGQFNISEAHACTEACSQVSARGCIVDETLEWLASDGIARPREEGLHEMAVESCERGQEFIEL